MVKQDLLASSKGPHGGFYLNMPAIDIPVMQVIEVLDGQDLFNNCVIRTSACDPEHPCSLHHKLAPVREQIKQLFNTETIADLVSEFRDGKDHIRI